MGLKSFMEFMNENIKSNTEESKQKLITQSKELLKIEMKIKKLLSSQEGSTRSSQVSSINIGATERTRGSTSRTPRLVQPSPRINQNTTNDESSNPSPSPRVRATNTITNTSTSTNNTNTNTSTNENSGTSVTTFVQTILA